MNQNEFFEKQKKLVIDFFSKSTFDKNIIHQIQAMQIELSSEKKMIEQQINSCSMLIDFMEVANNLNRGQYE